MVVSETITKEEAEKIADLFIMVSKSEHETDSFYNWMKPRLLEKLSSENRELIDVCNADIENLFIEYVKQGHVHTLP